MINSISDILENIFIFLLISNICVTSYIFVSGEATNITSSFYVKKTITNEVYNDTDIVLTDIFDEVTKRTPRLVGPLPHISYILRDHNSKTKKIANLKKEKKKHKAIIKPLNTGTSEQLRPLILNIRQY